MLRPPFQTVAEWQRAGYRGLSIRLCPDCRTRTDASWQSLEAQPEDNVVRVAERVRCSGCGRAPAGLGVIASMFDKPAAV